MDQKHKKQRPRRRRRSMSRRYVTEFLKSSERARELHGRLVVNGYAVKVAGADPKPLSQPDRRDLAEHLFFEVAARFEQFAKRTLILEVQKSLRVNKTRAEHMVGSSENGIPTSMGGWAHVSKMSKRAEGLLGMDSVYARIETQLKNPRVKHLQIALRIRNRIAHGPGNKDFTDMLGEQPFNLSKTKRKGVGPGKLLAEYPKGAAPADKWFFRLLDAYDDWVRIVSRKV